MKALLRTFRRWRYKLLIRELERADCCHFMCHRLAGSFPWFGISSYPELWDRRPPNTIVWFERNRDRINFIKEAIRLTYDRERVQKTKKA